MPLSFLWAVPHHWTCKYNLAPVSTNLAVHKPASPPSAAPAPVPRRQAVAKLVLPAANTLENVVQSGRIKTSRSSRLVHAGPETIGGQQEQYSSGAACRRLAAQPWQGLNSASGSVCTSRADNTSQHSQQHAAQPDISRPQHLHGAVLTQAVCSAPTAAQLIQLLKNNASGVNHIHITAGFKALVALQQEQHSIQQQLQFQDDARAAAAGLLRLASRNANDFTMSERRYVLWAVTQLQLHPWTRWYRDMLSQQQWYSTLQQDAANSTESSSNAQSSSHSLLDSQLVARLIGNAASLKELQAILQACWPALTGQHVTAALQQLQRIHQQHSNTSPLHGQHQQQQLGKKLALQLLQCVVPALQPSAATSSSGGAAVAVQKTPLIAELTAQQIAGCIKVAAALDLQLDADQTGTLLHKLLQQAVVGAVQMSGAALVSLTASVTELMQQLQQHQQQQQQQQQQHQQHQQQQHQQQQQLRLRAAASQKPLQQQQQQQQRHPASDLPVVVEADRQRQMMEQRRLMLLQRQQQEQQQVRQMQHQQQGHDGTLLETQHQQRHRVQVLLSSVLAECCCNPSSLLRAHGLQLGQLAAVLKACQELKLLPGFAVLQQLLEVSGLEGSNSSSLNTQAHCSNVAQQQQQQEGQVVDTFRSCDAAAVLWHLVVLAELEQQQQLLVVVPATQLHNSSSSGSSTISGVSHRVSVMATLQRCQPLAPLLTAVTAIQRTSAAVMAPTSMSTAQGSKQQAPADVHTICVALAAAAKLAAAVDAAAGAAKATALLMQPDDAPGAAAVAGHSVVHPTSAGIGAVVVQQAGLAGLGVETEIMQQLLDTLLQLAERQRQQQQQRQWLGKSEAVSALEGVMKVWRHLVQHSTGQDSSTHHQLQQQKQGSISSQQQQQHQWQHRRHHYMTSWVCRYAVAILPQVKICSPERLTQLLLLLVDPSLTLQHMPGYWLSAVEARVLYHIKSLCQGSSSSDAKPAVAAKLLHAWAKLLLQSTQQQTAVHGTAAAVVKGSRSALHKGAIQATAAGVIMGFGDQAAAVLAPFLCEMAPQDLSLAGWAIAHLGLSNAEPWLHQLLPAVSATVSAAVTAGDPARGSSNSSAQLAAASTLAIPLPGAAAYGVPAAVAATAVPTTAAVTAAGDARSSPPAGGSAAVQQSGRIVGALSPQVLLDLLQSLLLLRCRPPLPLLQQALALAQRDMLAYAKGSVLVGLLLVLVQLRVRPGPGWMRAVLLRVQGKLRMLNFNELTQLCWCLAQMGVVPPQPWQDDFADTAAVHVIAWKKQQRQRKEHKKTTPQVDAIVGIVSSSQNAAGISSSLAAAAAYAAAATPAGDKVHAWQLLVIRWAFSCWGYRPGHAVGKLQYRLVRELNAVAWGVHSQQRQWQQYNEARQRQAGSLHKHQRQKLEMLRLCQKVRRHRHMQLKLLRYYRRRRMSASWQAAAAATADAANHWAYMRGRTAGSRTTESTLRHGRQQQGSEPQQHQQQRQPKLWSWGRLLKQQQAAGPYTRVERGAQMLIERMMRRRAAAVWPKQWRLVLLEP